MAEFTAGSALQKGNAATWQASSSWTTIGGSGTCIQSITPPTATVEEVVVPACVSDSTPVNSYSAGAIDPGSVTVTMLYTDGQIDTTLGYLRNPSGWRIVLGSTGQKIAFSGFVSSVSPGELTANGYIVQTVTIRLTEIMDEVASA